MKKIIFALSFLFLAISSAQAQSGIVVCIYTDSNGNDQTEFIDYESNGELNGAALVCDSIGGVWVALELEADQ
ncbi:hypothetical protein [Marinicella sp. W31]|uniref:hypothetical protein n=1 Tax=Marinicella sp. W31 TaxID=3023713 RepID=UPI00375713D6